LSALSGPPALPDSEFVLIYVQLMV